jgi:hypothetical protein
MTYPSDPSGSDVSGQPTEPTEPQPASAPAASAPSAPASSMDPAAMMARLDAAGRMVASGAGAVIIILLLGVVVGAWSLSGYALIVLVAAIVAIVIPFLGGGAERMPIPARDLLLGAGLVMAVLSVLNLFEMLLDLDQIDDKRGGIVGLVLTVALALAAIVALVGTTRGRSIAEEAGGAMREGDRGTRIALAGLGLDLIGLLLMLTISVFALSAGLSFAAAALVLAVLILVTSGRSDSGWSLPFSPAWIAVVLAAIATLTLLDQIGQVGRVNDRFGLDAIDFLAFALHLIGTLLVLGGAIWSAVERQGLMPPKPTSDATDAPGGQA